MQMAGAGTALSSLLKEAAAVEAVERGEGGHSIPANR